MKKTNHWFTALFGVVALLLLVGVSAPTVQAKSYGKPIYVIELQKHYLHWSSGSESYAWVSFYETSSQDDAESVYQFLHWAFWAGHLDYLNTIEGTMITTVVDIRLVVRYQSQPALDATSASQARPINRLSQKR